SALKRNTSIQCISVGGIEEAIIVACVNYSVTCPGVLNKTVLNKMGLTKMGLNMVKKAQLGCLAK
ncbi:MAG: hypothetical protein ACRDL7_07170, partial [Gaiellaceae bacterium]